MAMKARQMTLGVVCDVRHDRGCRTVSARSTLSIKNKTASPVLIRTDLSAALATALGKHWDARYDQMLLGAGSAVVVRREEKQWLPLAYTLFGSEGSMASLRFEPDGVPDGDGIVLQNPDRGYIPSTSPSTRRAIPPVGAKPSVQKPSGLRQGTSATPTGKLLIWTDRTALLYCGPTRVQFESLEESVSPADAATREWLRSHGLGSAAPSAADPAADPAAAPAATDLLLPWICIVQSSRESLRVLRSEEDEVEEEEEAEAEPLPTTAAATAINKQRMRELAELQLPASETCIDSFRSSRISEIQITGEKSLNLRSLTGLGNSDGSTGGRVYLTPGYLCVRCVGSGESGAMEKAIPWSAVEVIDRSIALGLGAAATAAKSAVAKAGTAIAERSGAAAMARGAASAAAQTKSAAAKSSTAIAERSGAAAVAEGAASFTRGLPTSSMADSGEEVVEALRSSFLEGLDAAVGAEVVVRLKHGGSLTFEFRDETTIAKTALAKMRELHARAIRMSRSPAAGWQPRELTLIAPLLIASFLPSSVEIRLTQRARRPSGRSGHKVDESLMGHLNKDFLDPPLPIDALLPSAQFTIRAGASRRFHSFHAWTALELYAQLPRADGEPLRGEIEVCLPEKARVGHKQISQLQLHVGGRNTALSVTLLVEIKSHGAQCELRLFAPHWLYNKSSVPLALYGSGAKKPVTTADAHSALPHYFTLAFEGATEKVGDKARLAYAKSDVIGSQSGAFPINVTGSSTPLSVPVGHGEMVEVSVTVERDSSVPVGMSNVTNVHDRFVVHNATSETLWWREAPPAKHRGNELGRRHAFGAELVVPPGAQTGALRFRNYDARRLMQVRFATREHEWCCAFSPFQMGTFTLKFRPNLDEELSYAIERYLVLHVTQERAQTVHYLDEPKGHFSGARAEHVDVLSRHLPFRIANESNMLLAFRQVMTSDDL